MNLVPLLKRCELFIGLEEGDFQKIANLASWQRNTYYAGDFIFREGDLSKELYILEEGEISLIVASRKGVTKKLMQVTVDTVTKGDIFGWSALVAPHSRNMSAICIKRSTVMSVSGTQLNELMNINHSLGYEVMKSLVSVVARRLRDLQGKLAGK
jgi:CRP/FNR family cyclic AMP-dependent transcriptional regulator